jgi:hypothetical protein
VGLGNITLPFYLSPNDFTFIDGCSISTSLGDTNSDNLSLPVLLHLVTGILSMKNFASPIIWASQNSDYIEKIVKDLTLFLSSIFRVLFDALTTSSDYQWFFFKVSLRICEFFIFDIVSNCISQTGLDLCSLCWPPTNYSPGDFKLPIFLPQPPSYWSYRLAPPCPAWIYGS